jgi:hypothetical protein
LRCCEVNSVKRLCAFCCLGRLAGMAKTYAEG